MNSGKEAIHVTETVESKLANALIRDAELSEALRAVLGLLPPLGNIILSTVSEFKQYHEGLWVGGRLTLTKTQLSFEPNVVNKWIHKAGVSFVIPLNAISKITLESGFITKIIAIGTSDRTLRVRCYGAAKFLEKVQSAMQLSAHT